MIWKFHYYLNAHVKHQDIQTYESNAILDIVYRKRQFYLFIGDLLLKLGKI